MLEGVLPVGSVVLLKDSTKKVMIIGVCQFQAVEGEPKPRIWDYVACPFPEGYQGPNECYLFNGDQIENVYAIGYQDEEQMIMKTKYDRLLAELRKDEGQ